MYKINDVSEVSLVNRTTSEKLLKIDNFKPATQQSNLSDRPKRIKIPIEVDRKLLTNETVASINDGDYRMELEGNINGETVKITYHSIKTDGKDFYGLILQE